jgi:hypothetical protein
MERKAFNYENHPFIWEELFFGNWDFFAEVVKNPETLFVYDIDGILANSYKIVTDRFTEKTGIKISPKEVDRWDYLTYVAKKFRLAEDIIKHAEDDWFKEDVLINAQRFLYTRPLVRKTVNYYGAERNFVLTSRNANLDKSTFEWFSVQFPEILKENILIRKFGGIDMEESIKFKVGNLHSLAKKAPWVVFVDDSTTFTKAVTEAGIENCLVINMPFGKMLPKVRHERFILIKRFPEEIQGMYSLLYAVDRVINGRTYQK